MQHVHKRKKQLVVASMLIFSATLVLPFDTRRSSAVGKKVKSSTQPVGGKKKRKKVVLLLPNSSTVKAEAA